MDDCDDVVQDLLSGTGAGPQSALAWGLPERTRERGRPAAVRSKPAGLACIL